MTMTNRQPVTEAGRYPVTDAIRHHRPIVGRSADHYALIRCECGYRDHPAGWFAHLTVEVAERAEIEAQASLSEARTAELVEALRLAQGALNRIWSTGWFMDGLPDDFHNQITGASKAVDAALAATDTTAPDAEREELTRANR